MKLPILLIGGGGHCKSCIDVIEREGAYQIAGIVDLPEKMNQAVLGYPVLGSDAELPELLKSCQNVLITLGQIKSPVRRIELFEYLKRIGAVFSVIQSSEAFVSAHAQVGEGTIVMHHATVNSGAKIGLNCIINTGAIIEHDAVIGDHSHISTGAIINGGTVVGNRSFIGSGAITKQYVRIAEASFIRAGSFVKDCHE